ncbi:MAG: alanine racemase [Acidobacteriota bacterium]
MMQNVGKETVWAEINLDRLKGNLDFARGALPAGTRIMAVVKANAYGHGAVEIAKYLERQGIDWLAVFSPEEGAELREHGVRTPILLLEYPGTEGLEKVIRYELTPALYDTDMARELSAAACRAGCRVKTHVRVDTGCSGAGIQPDEAPSLLERIKDDEYLECEGIFTHLNASYGEQWKLADNQVELFDQVISNISGTGVLTHAASSPALLRVSGSAYDMVRLGIMMYGIGCQNESVDPYIEPVMQLKACVSSINQVGSDSRIGYGWSVTTSGITTVASVGIGYSHALFLYFLKDGQVLVKGQRAPIIGRVAMNHLLVDISHVEGVQPGDEVVIIGEQGLESIKVAEIASQAGIGRDNYDVVCLINNTIPRLYIENGRHRTENISSNVG